MEEQELPLLLVKFLGNKEQLELIAEATDVILHAGWDFKDIPVVGLVVKISTVGLGIRERLFMKKLARFSSAARDLRGVDLEKWTKQLGEEKFRREVGEQLLLILDRLDHMNKAELVGRAFKAWALARVTYDEYSRLIDAIHRAYLPDLMQLKLCSGVYRGADSWVVHLMTCGLADLKLEIRWDTSRTQYEVNDLGRLLVSVCLDEELNTRQ